MIPAKRHPIMLTANVPQGKTDETCFDTNREVR